MRSQALIGLSLLVLACGGGSGSDDPGTTDTASETPPTGTSTTDTSTTDTSTTDPSTTDTATDPGTPWASLDADLVARLDAAVAAAPETIGSPGVALAVVDLSEHAMWVGSAGLAELDPERPWTPQLPYAIGSVSKTYTTSIVMQLVDEGVVSLDDPVEDWVSTAWDGQGVTVRHLVQHTSGIVSYNYVGSFDKTGEYTPQELVAWAEKHEPTLRFAPGAQWEYSNTNFVLLGLIVEQATGGPFEDALQSRLLTPLGLADTSLPAAYDADLVRGYQSDGKGGLYDATAEGPPSVGWAAGGMQATPADVAAWGAALFGGDVVSGDRLAEMTTPLVIDGETVGYGLGLFGGIDADWGASWGHTGGTGGHLTYVYWLEDADAVVVAMVNSFEGDVEDAATLAWIEVLDLEL